jgi:nucleoside-diphosphate-sugar epimerase
VRVLVTGASGFLGRHVVDAALDAGHDVVALVRPTAEVRDLDPSRVAVVRGDLRQRGPWVDEVRDVEAVVHLAAAPSGDLAEQWAGTVVATENLLAELDLARLERMVHVSTFSVYDFAGIPAGSTIDEESPLEPSPEERDAYTITKVAQEQLVRAAADDAGCPLVVIRPGAVYGPGKDWDHGAALTIGRLAIVIAPRSTMRLTHVRNCADAIVRSLESADAAGATIDVVDDDLPTHWQYFRTCRDAGTVDTTPIPAPWSVVDGIGRLLATISRVFLGGRAKLPELLAWRRQQARWKPFRYSNARAKDLLGWSPTISVRAGVADMARAPEATTR